MVDWLTSTELLHNPILAWLYAAAGALIGALVANSVIRFFEDRLRRRDDAGGKRNMARKALLALLHSTRGWLLFLLAIVLAAATLHFNARVGAALGNATFGLIGLQVALWANSLIDLWLGQAPQAPGAPPMNPIVLGLLSWGAQLVVWTTLLMAFLDNAGVNITAFVASLGIGGVAVALALQNVLGDLFASIAIGLDKPFEVGQFIAFGNSLGTVERVGVKTTRINSLSGEQLIISNANLLKELVRNYSRMQQRRVVFGFRVPYGTSRDQVQTIVERVHEFIKSEEKARFDRGHFTGFGEYGLEFEFVYYVLDPDFSLYRDIQQRVNVQIMDLLAGMNVEFAVPARRVRVNDDTR